MTAKQITEIIDLLNHKHNTGSHVTLFEFIATRCDPPQRFVFWLHDSGSKMIGPGGEHSRYRCVVRTEDCKQLGLKGKRGHLKYIGKHYADPKEAVRETVDDLLAWIAE